MKSFILLILFAGAAISAVIPDDERINGENGWYVPRVDGSFEWVDLEDAQSYLEEKSKLETRFNINPVTFYLYTRSNPNEHRAITLNKKSIEDAYFNATHPTCITIHGWRNGKEKYINEGIRNAYLSKGDHNMIFVDWSRARSIDYISSVIAVPGVGQKVAELIDFLVKEFNMTLDSMKIIGHSLGAHVAGYAGKNVKSGKLRTIIGLDPALPLFCYKKPHKRLSSTDAYYVESIQTNGNKLGFLKPIGKGAFYPNGGKSQPGCGIDFTGSCSHSRSIVYYVESVEKDNFASIKCESYGDAVHKNCGSTYSSVRMGAITNVYTVEGTFYVPINKNAPYGMLS